MTEVWKDVEGYEGRLQVSSEGRVRTLPSLRAGVRNGKPGAWPKPGVVLRPWAGAHGYLQVAPKFGASRKKLLVHRLVAKAFVAGHFDGASVNHIDGNKQNNRPANLEWITLAQNTAHQWAIGLVDLRGEKQPGSKLKERQVKEIYRRRAEKASVVAREFGVSRETIRKIQLGRGWSWLTGA